MGSLHHELADEWVDSATDLRRFANNSIRDVAVRREREASTVYEFLCECGDLRCRGLVELTLGDYSARPPGSVRAHT
ncbi:MAG TPA: hypothetical protein VGF66_12285 [Gaiellaceae bacterium]|jgi:hypothetical protein